MTTSRRNFLKKGAIGALAAGVSLGIAETSFGSPALLSRAEDSLPDMAAFKAQLKTEFRIGKSKVPLQLIDVLKIGSRDSREGKKEAFTLTFRGNPKSALKQETYTIEHHKLGAFSLLVVPIVARDKDSRYYEVAINRLHS